MRMMWESSVIQVFITLHNSAAFLYHEYDLIILEASHLMFFYIVANFLHTLTVIKIAVDIIQNPSVMTFLFAW